jgi:hypothetical protein
MTFSGCYGTYYGSAGGYHDGPAYSGGYDYYDEPTLVRYDEVYVGGVYSRVPIYCYHDDVYYLHGGRRHYFSGSDAYRYRTRGKHRSHDHDNDHDNRKIDNRGSQDYYRYQREVAENKAKTKQYSLEQDLRQQQARASYDQQRKQYQYQQQVAQNRAHVAQNRAEIQRSTYRAQASQQKKQYEYQQKVAQARQKQQVNEWKAKQNYEKKKKKDD